MQRSVKEFKLADQQTVKEILPFIFLKNGELVYEQLPSLGRAIHQSDLTEAIDEETWDSAVRLLSSKVMLTAVLPGIDPGNDPIGFAALIAAAVHLNQLDKSGFPYIEHPRRVFLNSDWSLDPKLFSDQERVNGHQAAWLHDVIEDSEEFFYRPITSGDLSNWGFNSEVIAVVVKLTKSPQVESSDYYETIKRDPIARAVKLADIADNLAKWRQDLLDRGTRTKLQTKYQLALVSLEYKVDKETWFEARINSLVSVQ